MLVRMLTEAGATVLHHPMPMSTHTSEDGVWTVFSRLEWDAAVVITRDFHCTIKAQVEAGHVRDEAHAIERTRAALTNIYVQLGICNKPWFPVTYESLARPGAVHALCRLLGLDDLKVRTVWHDANAKHYGGAEWSEHRPLWALPMSDGSAGMSRNHPNYPPIKSHVDR
jgi:hypothetical protein